MEKWEWSGMGEVGRGGGRRREDCLIPTVISCLPYLFIPAVGEAPHKMLGHGCEDK